MSDIKLYIETLFAHGKIEIKKDRIDLFNSFVLKESNINSVKTIKENQNLLMEKWKVELRIRDLIEKQIVIPNGTVGKPYEANLDFSKLGFDDLVSTEFEGLEAYGLNYDNEAEIIKGIPSQSGDFKIKMRFRIKNEADNAELNLKPISLVINADPKSLWKDIASVKEDNNYWKPDRVSDFQNLGDKHIVVASTRGRSHANVGSFRDDDFAFKNFEQNGWSVVCVADGAGGYPLTRQGSKLACEGVVEYFEGNLNAEILKMFDEDLINYHHTKDEESSKKISLFVYNNLSKAALHAHRKIEDFSIKAEKQLKDFHSTLIFALYKKYEFGYAVLSFGVGDCPIGLLNKDLSEITLMNWLDVGEFGGGTRFITMPEIFTSDKFSTRFGFKLIDDFSYLMMMTDGIYDAKFVVESNLEKIENWKEFIDDLKGKNEENIKVNLDPENKDIANELSAWMDFWSPGNHDDRTLAIIF